MYWKQHLFCNETNLTSLFPPVPFYHLEARNLSYVKLWNMNICFITIPKKKS